MPLSELSLDYQYPVVVSEGIEQSYDPYSSLIVPAGPSDYCASENLYLWQDADGIYQWTDAPTARSGDSCLAYSSPPYYASTFSPETLPVSDYCGYRHADLEERSPPNTQDNLYTFLAQQVRNGFGRPQVQDHRSSIARACDNFLAQGSSIFSDGHSSPKRGNTADYHSSIPHQSSPQRDTRPPSRKRSRELDDESYHLKEEDDSPLPSSLSAAHDAFRLPQPHITIPPQVLPSSTRISRRGDAATSFSKSHAREHEPRLHLGERCPPKHMNNKRVHRSNEGPVRQESTIVSPPTWPIPDDQSMKGTKKPGEQKKQALACLFCRERKIACGRPPPLHPDQTCNQCARRGITCQYPTESRRGQHKRRRKPIESDPAQSTARTNPPPNIPSSVTPTILTTGTTPSV